MSDWCDSHFVRCKECAARYFDDGAEPLRCPCCGSPEWAPEGAPGDVDPAPAPGPED